MYKLKVERLKKDNLKFKYRGGIHIHSKNSDGTGDVDTITKAAKKAGLSWIIVTDHDNFDIDEGIFNDVYLIKGEEISPQKENHYLAIGINEKINSTSNPQIYINKVREQNGIGFAAHPDEQNERNNNYPPIRWNKLFIPDGVEIWNWFSTWGDNFNSKNIFRLIYSFLFKHNLVSQASPKTLAWWDELNSNSNNIIPAIGGIDAHALKIKDYILPVTVFSYDSMLKTINNIIYLNEELSKDFQTAKQQIFIAIKNANNLIVNKYISENIPTIKVTNKTQCAYIGETIKLDAETFLNIETSQKSIIKIILNGQELYKIFAKKCELLLTKIGKYRIEIFVKGRAFAYSNPIVVI